jgi:hypothetical protein
VDTGRCSAHPITNPFLNAAMHPLVRDLYKRVILVGRDYPLGLDYVRSQWKKAIRNPNNCPSCYRDSVVSLSSSIGYHPTQQHQNDGNPKIKNVIVIDPVPCIGSLNCERELRKAVGKGRHYVREMVGIIQFKKYRAMKKRYDDRDDNDMMQQKLKEIVDKGLYSKSK